MEEDPALVFVDEPGEWAEFLNSNTARQLAERQVSERIGAGFAIDSHKDALQLFVNNVISSGSRRAVAPNEYQADGLSTNYR